ncbi:MAG: hypothetical protein LBC07_02175, partial [Elusimicrobiota bacterium]|nr:hypothetical protein [Elusimicrobiota bacterium]
YALLNGDRLTGVTSFFIEKTLDTGKILLQKSLEILPCDDAKTLFEKLVNLGIIVMDESLDLLKTQNFKTFVQTGAVSFAPAFKKNDGLINWRLSAAEICNKVRALVLWPGAWAFFLGQKFYAKRLKIVRAKIIENESANEDFGAIDDFKKHGGFSVLCGRGKILVEALQVEGKGICKAWDFLQGAKISKGDKLGNIS